jgi:hypothetical protein
MFAEISGQPGIRYRIREFGLKLPADYIGPVTAAVVYQNNLEHIRAAML